MKLAVLALGGISRNPSDGTIPVLHWMVERLARRHEVHVYTFYGSARSEKFQLLGATVHHLGGSRPATLRALMAEHRRRHFDLLHAFWLIPAGAIAAAAGLILRLPVLVHVAGGELVDLPEIRYGNAGYPSGRLWSRLALAGAARITVASTPMLESVGALGYRAERIPLGVDLGAWPVAAPRPRPLSRPARLLHVATLNRVKDQGTLVEGARLLADRQVAFTLDVIGPDTLGGSVQRMAADAGLGERVRFHGYLPHSRVRVFMEEADLLWITSRHEAGPMVLLEAAVAGVPAVATGVGHVIEWAPEAAVAIPIGDAQALAQRTADLLGDEDRRLQIAREAQRRAAERDANWTVQRFEEIYREVTASRRRRAS